MGGRHPIVWGDNLHDGTINKKKYIVALGGRQAMIKDTTTNQKQAPIIEESTERSSDHRGSAGGCNSIVLGAEAVK